MRVVEACRDQGKTRHRTVLNPRRRDLLAEHLDLNKLMRLLQGDAAAVEPGSDVASRRGARRCGLGLGPDVELSGGVEDGMSGSNAQRKFRTTRVLVAGHIWREFGLEMTIDRLSRPARCVRCPPRAFSSRSAATIRCAGPC